MNGGNNKKKEEEERIKTQNLKLLKQRMGAQRKAIGGSDSEQSTPRSVGSVISDTVSTGSNRSRKSSKGRKSSPKRKNDNSIMSSLAGSSSAINMLERARNMSGASSSVTGGAIDKDFVVSEQDKELRDQELKYKQRQQEEKQQQEQQEQGQERGFDFKNTKSIMNNLFGARTPVNTKISGSKGSRATRSSSKGTGASTSKTNAEKNKSVGKLKNMALFESRLSGLSNRKLPTNNSSQSRASRSRSKGSRGSKGSNVSRKATSVTSTNSEKPRRPSRPPPKSKNRPPVPQRPRDDTRPVFLSREVKKIRSNPNSGKGRGRSPDNRDDVGNFFERVQTKADRFDRERIKGKFKKPKPKTPRGGVSKGSTNSKGKGRRNSRTSGASRTSDASRASGSSAVSRGSKGKKAIPSTIDFDRRSSTSSSLPPPPPTPRDRSSSNTSNTSTPRGNFPPPPSPISKSPRTSVSSRGSNSSKNSRTGLISGSKAKKNPAKKPSLWSKIKRGFNDFTHGLSTGFVDENAVSTKTEPQTRPRQINRQNQTPATYGLFMNMLQRAGYTKEQREIIEKVFDQEEQKELANNNLTNLAKFVRVITHELNQRGFRLNRHF